MKKDGDVEPVDRLDVMNAKLDELLAACGKIEFLKNEKWTERRIEKFEGFTGVCREGD